jgi:hypothetical protein
MYNFFSVKIGQVEDRVEFFCIDLMNVLSRELDMLSIRNSNPGAVSGKAAQAASTAKKGSGAKQAPISTMDDDI